MADFKYIMQGFQKDINFFDEIKEVLETEDYTSIWILTAFVNERAICNLMPSIKKSKADISFIIGIRNNVSTYQALKCLINMKVSVFVFDTARIESIFHAKVIVGSGTNSAKVICGSANITTGGLANNIEAGIISKLNLRCESDEKFLTEVREYIDNIIHNYPQNVKKISEDRELDELYEQGLVVDENQRKLRNNFFCASKEKQEKSIVSRFPLVNKKLLNFGKKQKQTNAILRKLDQVIVEEVCEEVWKSNKLTKSHLGIVKKGTHAKGEMSLGKGQYRQIDQFTYFRDTVFRDLDWKNNKSGDEIANAYFTMIICGINYGEYKLRILHKRKGMVAYQQNNYVTSIRWGDVSHLLKNENLLAGVFKGKTEANNRITRLLRSTEFSDENSVLDLVNSIILAVDEDIDNSEKKITDKKEFYDYLYGLEYVGVSFK